MTEIPDERRERIADDPFCEVLGIELTALGPGSARTKLTVSEDLLNFHGTPHGGAVYSLADAAFAAASNAEGDTALAMETNVSYFEAVSVGDTLTAEAERLHQRGRTAAYRVTVTEKADEAAEHDEDDEAGETDEPVATFRGRVYLPDE